MHHIILSTNISVFLHNEKGQRISRQTALPLWYPVNTQRLTHTNQTDPHRPMFEHERFDMTQQLPQLLELHLRVLVYLREFTLTERELLDRSEHAILVKGVMDMWGLGKVQLGVRFRPVHACALMSFDFKKVRLRYLRRSRPDNIHIRWVRG